MATTEKQAPPCFTIVKPRPEFLNASYNDVRLRSDIEKGDMETKRRALETVIHLYLSEPSRLGSSMLMTVIRFLLPVRDHKIKRLLLLFWEVVPKVDAKGKLRPEMILVCDSFRRDLQHPNEFIRGSTLRLLCKIQYPEILESLIPCILACLEHPHSYVRRNAVFCILATFRNHSSLLPDASRVISNVLETDHDPVTKKNAFIALCEIDQPKALNFVESSGEALMKYCREMQLRIVELIYHVCLNNPEERWRFLTPVFFLTSSKCTAVRLEAAWVFTTISTSQNASLTAAKIYTDLAVSEADNNVKLIVLSKLKHLCDERPGALTHLALELLRVLANANDTEVQKKTLELSFELVTSRTIKEYVAVLKKQLRTTEAVEFHELIVETLHKCVKKFAQIAPTIVRCLVELVWSDTPTLAVTVLRFLRDTFLLHPNACGDTLSEILQSFELLVDNEVLQQTCWLLGEFCTDPDQIEEFVETVKASMGTLLVTDPDLDSADKKTNTDSFANGDCKVNQSTTINRVTADGTYASQSAFSIVKAPPPRKFGSVLRSHLTDGFYFVAVAVCGALAKVATKMPLDSRGHRVRAESLVIVVSCLRAADCVREGEPVKIGPTADDIRRLHQFITMILKNSASETAVLARDALHEMLKTDRANSNELLSTKSMEKKVNKEEQVDEPITFGVLTPRGRNVCSKNVLRESLEVAVKGNPIPQKGLFDNTLLSKVLQLTGRNDAIYSEAYVTVTPYTLELDVLVVNQTDDTLQNCTLELRVWGRRMEGLTEKPAPVTLGPKDFTSMRAVIEATDKECGFIFGSFVYDTKGSTADRHIVALEDLRTNVVDFLIPKQCSDAHFRLLWETLEWENKVSVNTSLRDMNLYINILAESARMAVLTDKTILQNECGFGAANFYTTTMFGEDVVANVSLFRTADGKLDGHIRVRATSQGLALRLGEKFRANVPQRDFDWETSPIF